jgi:predicted MFS family arabinose efflux permease
VFGVGGGGLMTIGQMSEIAVLATIPLFAKRLSRKHLLAIGILAYAARMALFAYTDSLATVLLGVALHGLCFGCFLFVAFMIVDEETTDDVRASAQNLFNLVMIGIGIAVGSWISTSVVGAWAMGADGVMDYTRLFSVPMWASLACLVILLFFYPSRSAARPSAEPTEVRG